MLGQEHRCDAALVSCIHVLQPVGLLQILQEHFQNIQSASPSSQMQSTPVEKKRKDYAFGVN